MSPDNLVTTLNEVFVSRVRRPVPWETCVFGVLHQNELNVLLVTSRGYLIAGVVDSEYVYPHL